jgi:Glycosyl transferase family 2
VTERRRHLRLTVQRAEVEAEPVGPPSRASERALASPSAVASSAPAATSELRAAPADAEAHAGTLVEPEPTPVLSVIVVSYNCRLPLAACLSSLEAQRDELPLEVILVDNDSRDGTAYEVASRFPWVRLVVNRGNVGFARAVNTGLRFSRGEYLLVLNPDTVAPVGSIARAVHELERHPDVGMLGCKLVRPDGSFDHACKRGFPTVRSAIYYFTGLARAFPKSARFAQYTAAHLSVDEAGPVDAVNGAFMLVRRRRRARRALLAVGRGSRLVPSLLGAGVEGAVLAGSRSHPPQEFQRWKPPLAPPEFRLSPQHLALLCEALRAEALAVLDCPRVAGHLVEVRRLHTRQRDPAAS